MNVERLCLLQNLCRPFTRWAISTVHAQYDLSSAASRLSFSFELSLLLACRIAFFKHRYHLAFGTSWDTDQRGKGPGPSTRHIYTADNAQRSVISSQRDSDLRATRVDDEANETDGPDSEGSQARLSGPSNFPH